MSSEDSVTTCCAERVASGADASARRWLSGEQSEGSDSPTLPVSHEPPRNDREPCPVRPGQVSHHVGGFGVERGAIGGAEAGAALEIGDDDVGHVGAVQLV